MYSMPYIIEIIMCLYTYIVCHMNQKYLNRYIRNYSVAFRKQIQGTLVIGELRSFISILSALFSFVCHIHILLVLDIYIKKKAYLDFLSIPTDSQLNPMITDKNGGTHSIQCGVVEGNSRTLDFIKHVIL